MNSESNARDLRLDAIRGLFLILMAAVHVPTPLSHLLQEPFGFTGSAEGFLFLSACLSGLVYGKIYRQTDWPTMARRVWHRTRLIYFIHLGLVVPVALIAWLAANQLPPLANHFHDFLVHPWGSLALMPLLLHQPPLFDILPLYVILLGATPWLLVRARRHGWKWLLLVSAFGWLLAQTKWNAQLMSQPTRWLPYRWGSFDLLAWQFLWVGGLALGETILRRPIIQPQHRLRIGGIAAALVGVGILARHGFWPAAWFSSDVFLWTDKWTLGPLRLLNFAAWVALLLAWNPRLPGWLLSPSALLGRNSLAVFSFHLPLVIAATTAVLLLSPSVPQQFGIGLLVIAALFPWAVWCESLRHPRPTLVANQQPARRAVARQPPLTFRYANDMIRAFPKLAPRKQSFGLAWLGFFGRV